MYNYGFEMKQIIYLLVLFFSFTLFAQDNPQVNEHNNLKDMEKAAYLPGKK